MAIRKVAGRRKPRYIRFIGTVHEVRESEDGHTMTHCGRYVKGECTFEKLKGERCRFCYRTATGGGDSVDTSTIASTPYAISAGLKCSHHFKIARRSSSRLPKANY